MTRAISTVLDVGVAIVLIGASVAVFAGVPAPAEETDTLAPSTGGSGLAGSTMTVQYERTDGQAVVVTGTVAGLLRDAAIARHEGDGDAYVDAVEESVADRIDATGTPTQLLGTCGTADDIGSGANRTQVVSGPSPPTGQPVEATVYRWNTSATGTAADCHPAVVLRRWSA
jgi:hypothetical protein